MATNKKIIITLCYEDDGNKQKYYENQGDLIINID